MPPPDEENKSVAVQENKAQSFLAHDGDKDEPGPEDGEEEAVDTSLDERFLKFNKEIGRGTSKLFTESCAPRPESLWRMVRASGSHSFYLFIVLR